MAHVKRDIIIYTFVSENYKIGHASTEMTSMLRHVIKRLCHKLIVYDNGETLCLCGQTFLAV